MKKFLVTLAFATLGMSVFAQEATTTEDPVLNKYSVETNSFWSNWFVQANFNWSVFYSNQEHGLGLPGSPFKSFRSQPAMSLAIGKWFTPGIAARIKAYGLWGKAVCGTDAEYNKMKYYNIQAQTMFNLVNLIGGYNPKRIYDLSIFAGAGIGHNITCTQANCMTAAAGILNEFRLAKHWGLNLEFGWIYAEDDYDGVSKVAGTETGYFWKSHDQHFYAELGITYKFGQKVDWVKTPDVAAIKALYQSQIDALNSQLSDANAENARLKALLAQKPQTEKVETVVKEFASNPLSVFFNINKTQFASRKDLVDVKKLVEYAKENNSTLLVRGYADSKTGNVKINQRLSEGRANRLADELVKMGISRDNIKVEPKGGVLDISPVSYNRRATVEIEK